jgi:hypothetical protein
LINNNIIRNKSAIERCITLNDILSRDTALNVSQLYNVDLMTVNALRSKFKALKANVQSVGLFCITCNSRKNVNIEKISSKNLYKNFINNNIEVPTSVTKWETVHNINHNLSHWQYSWRLIKYSAKIKYERDFMIKFLHRQINTRYLLNIYGIEESNICILCNNDEIETIEHAYESCTYNSNIVSEIILWLNQKCSININITKFEYFIGILNELDNDMLFLYNRILWLCKYFIYLKRKNREIINKIEFIRWLKRYVKHFNEIFSDESKYVRKNRDIFEILEL